MKKEALETVLKRIGLKLVELRKKKGYTSYETFAYDHDIPRMQYWRMENGKINITMKSLLRLLAIHKLTLEEFISNLPKLPKTLK
jgi:transcriptional regulator with XRE-family HTH domain